MFKKIFIAAIIACTSCLSLCAQDFSDNFEIRRLDTANFHLWDNDETIVNMGTRGLTIMAKGDTPADANIVYYTANGNKWEAEAHVVLYPTSQGGFALMQDRNHFWAITADYRHIYVRTQDGVTYTVRNPYGRYLHMRLQYDNGKLTLSTAAQKTPWRIVDNANPGVVRKPGTNWTTQATFENVNGNRISFLSAKKDVVSIRDFWYRQQ